MSGGFHNMSLRRLDGLTERFSSCGARNCLKRNIFLKGSCTIYGTVTLIDQLGFSTFLKYKPFPRTAILLKNYKTLWTIRVPSLKIISIFCKFWLGRTARKANVVDEYVYLCWVQIRMNKYKAFRVSQKHLHAHNERFLDDLRFCSTDYNVRNKTWNQSNFCSLGLNLSQKNNGDLTTWWDLSEAYENYSKLDVDGNVDT